MIFWIFVGVQKIGSLLLLALDRKIPSCSTIFVDLHKVQHQRMNLKEFLTRIEEKKQCQERLISGWWFQPISKILVKLDHFPNFRGKNKKNIWNHHLDFYCLQCLQNDLMLLLDAKKFTQNLLTNKSPHCLKPNIAPVKKTYPLVNLYGNGISLFLIGNTSSIRVHFPASYVRLQKSTIFPFKKKVVPFLDAILIFPYDKMSSCTHHLPTMKTREPPIYHRFWLAPSSQRNSDRKQTFNTINLTPVGTQHT